ncbi:hypothetical protein GGH94_004322 [Coemansia aciculifera]|uniref:Tripeptidyl-peptidase II n=1 Tax=Coemansia aciculifera TaxID=417176 RepID=A0A9W8IFI4_9FUNG|nr:hypothetical protein GGH94_004322 [Coemansia aciculifera]
MTATGTQPTASPRAEFPTLGLLPRADTQAGDFVRKHPTYDGRGTVVAILDTGIDPGAKGLQLTSDGKRKVLDFVDCTGSGDVALSSPLKCSADADLELKGPSGRTLKLNPEWRNPSAEWRVGAKRLYDIAPSQVKQSVQAERKDRFTTHAQLLADSVSERLVESKKNSKPEDETRLELDAQAGVLASLAESYADQGPYFDCVVFHDGEQWRAAIDTAESGDLSEAPALGAYKLTGDVGQLCKRQLLYYTLNFYDDARTLSIVTSAGSHSTHVAGIVAANHPDEPQNNGVAPGAQLLSLLIGDHRVGSLESGVGLTRAANAIVEHRADLANMSFGEPTATSNVGQWVQLVRNEVVARHRCIFVSSAGNEGPALTTVGAPGGTTDGIIGVGAYVGYEQIKADHAMYDTVKDTIFTWCSRGPTADGALGVDIYAPGSAIASYPAYTQQRLHLANGTSMSSPNLCGCLALLVSAWKQELGDDSPDPALKISPYRIKNAIVATAKQFGDELGAGLVQTDAAWQYLKKHAERRYEDVEYTVRIMEANNSRGIYLRDAEDSACARHLQVFVTPMFPGDARAKLEHDSDGVRGETQSQAKFDYEQRVILVPSASWVRVPEALYVSSEGRVFSAKIDATQLEPGRLHVASIQGFDSACVDRGPIFTVPITVTKPLPVEASACVRFNDLRFLPTEVVRRFVAVPYGATKAHITIRASNAAANSSAPAMFYLHCLQLARHERFTKYQLKARVNIGHPSYVSGAGSAEQSYTNSMDVIGGATLEVCVAPFWSQLDAHEIDVSIEFNGILPAGSEHTGASADGHGTSSGIVVNGNYIVSRTDFVAPVRPEYEIKPDATLDTLRKALRPVEATISPTGSERDVHLTTGVMIQKLALEYKLEIKSDNTSLRLRMPAVDTQIYENWADDFALAVFDANKRRVAAQISYTSKITLKKKGDYLVRVQIRHRSAKELEALKDAPLLVDISLGTSIKLGTTFSFASALTNTVSGASSALSIIARGSRVPIFFKTDVGSLPSEAAPGDIIYGSLTLNKKTAKMGLEYVVPSAKSVEKESSNGNGSEKAAATEEDNSDRKAMDEAIRKLRVEWIGKMKNEAERTKLIAELAADVKDREEDYAAVLAAQLDTIDVARKTLPWNADAKLTEQLASKAVAIADKIVALSQASALTARLYENQTKENSKDEDKKLKKKADTAKTRLTNALISKCRALAYLATQTSFVSSASDASGEFVDVEAEEGAEAQLVALERAVAELGRWTDKKAQAESVEYLLASLPLHVAKQQYGRALQPVLKWIAAAPLSKANAGERKAMTELRDLLLAKLQWPVWIDHFRELALVDSPASYEAL